MPRFLRRLIGKVIGYVALPALVAAGGYGWWAKSRLDAKLAPDGIRERSTRISLVEPSASRVETSLPRVLRVAVKRADGPNWLPSPRAGLIHAAYDWSPARWEWIEVEPTLEEKAEALALRRLELQTPGQHIETLSDPDAHRREAASRLLVLRTGQDFGYRHDRPPETQEEAISRWRAWWEANKVGWTAGKVLEGVKDIFK